MNDKAWPKLEAANIPHGASIATEDVERILGPAITEDLKNVTRFIDESCNQNIASIATCIADMRRTLSQLYPDRPFVPVPQILN